MRNLAVLSQAQLNIPASALVGAQPGDYVPFCVTTVAGNGVTTTAAYIGRTADGSLTGPDGVSTQWRYPVRRIRLVGPRPSPAPIAVHWGCYAHLRLWHTGAAADGRKSERDASDDNLVDERLGRDQWVGIERVVRRDHEPDDHGGHLLHESCRQRDSGHRAVSVPQPAGVWNGLLIPYSFNQVLYFDLTGVYGYPPYVSSGTGPSNPVGIYQYLVGPNLQSVTTTITPPQS